MRHILLSLRIIILFIGAACNNDIIDNIAAFEFDTIDKDKNKIGLAVTVRYRLKSRLEEKLSNEHHGHYKDRLLLPVITSISKNVLTDYSTGEVYSYMREEIEQKLGEHIKTTFAEYGIESTSFRISAVELSDTLLRRFEQEHVNRFERAMNNCRKEVKGVITIHRDNIGHYEFTVGNKNYRGMLNKEEFDKLRLGDSVNIEYACEYPYFNRLE